MRPKFRGRSRWSVRTSLRWFSPLQESPATRRRRSYRELLAWILRSEQLRSAASSFGRPTFAVSPTLPCALRSPPPDEALRHKFCSGVSTSRGAKGGDEKWRSTERNAAAIHGTGAGTARRIRSRTTIFAPIVPRGTCARNVSRKKRTAPATPDGSDRYWDRE